MECILICIAIINVILFVTAVILAYRSYKAAMRSLAEATKARHDMFLPIIISKSLSDTFSGHYVSFCLQNVGHGIALYPQIRLIDLETTKIIEAYYWNPEISADITKKLSLESMDHRLTQGYYHWVCNLVDMDLTKLRNSDLKLEMHYRDIFERETKTTYNLTLIDRGQHYFFQLDHLQIQLPK